MNGMDIFVIAVIAVFVLIGIYHGFVLAAVRMVSALVSGLISLLGYPVICIFARKTFLYSSIKNTIIERLALKQMVMDGTRQGQTMLIEKLPLPAVFRDKLMENNNSVVYDMLQVDNVVDYIGGFLANIVLNILISILLFITCFVVIQLILNACSILRKAPVMRTIGRVGGGIAGFVTAVVFIWALFAMLDAFVTQPAFAAVYDDIQTSAVAIHFYNTNLIRTFMMSRMFL